MKKILVILLSLSLILLSSFSFGKKYDFLKKRNDKNYGVFVIDVRGNVGIMCNEIPYTKTLDFNFQVTGGIDIVEGYGFRIGWLGGQLRPVSNHIIKLNHALIGISVCPNKVFLEGGAILSKTPGYYVGLGKTITYTEPVSLKLMIGGLYFDHTAEIKLSLMVQWKIGYIKTSSCKRKTGFIFY